MRKWDKKPTWRQRHSMSGAHSWPAVAPTERRERMRDARDMQGGGAVRTMRQVADRRTRPVAVATAVWLLTFVLFVLFKETGP